MGFQVYDQNNERTHFSTQSSKLGPVHESLTVALDYLKEIITARKWNVLDIELDDDFADVAANNGSDIHTFTIEPV